MVGLVITAVIVASVVLATLTAILVVVVIGPLGIWASLLVPALFSAYLIGLTRHAAVCMDRRRS